LFLQRVRYFCTAGSLFLHSGAFAFGKAQIIYTNKMNNIKYILTDLEGTTTSIHFVHKVLFPYFLSHKALAESILGAPAQAQILADILETAKTERIELPNSSAASANPAVASATSLLARWCEEDRKHPALKAMQGLVWAAGYQSGELKGHFYADVPTALARWESQNISLGIYSSGSVGAQKLLVTYSEFGDLSAYFANYFDTAVGHKREVKSYQNIQVQLNIAAENILFLSDIKEELDAAAAAGMQTIHLVREGDLYDSGHSQLRDFNEILKG
jgi:enolase-phosphatase E1